jgi:hypothetical protein
MYVCNEVLPFADIEKAMLKTFKKIRVQKPTVETKIE